MKLNTWLKQQRGRKTALALHLKVSQAAITHLCNGRMKVPPRMMPFIQEFTGGAVLFAELQPKPIPKPTPTLWGGIRSKLFGKK
jgi:DNA-binding transcriptional regulator YdaS (Cro superfamily)